MGFFPAGNNVDVVFIVFFVSGNLFPRVVSVLSLLSSLLLLLLLLLWLLLLLFAWFVRHVATSATC